MREQLEEWKDEEKRKLNIILYNAPEELDCPDNDRTKTLDLVRLVLGESGESKIEKIVRLGRATPNTSRPICIQFRDTETKRTVISKAYKLKDSIFRHVAIARDLTPKQRVEQKIVYEEMKRRKLAGETDLVIRRGEIVNKSSITNSVNIQTIGRNQQSSPQSPRTNNRS